jgi:hypothetical protein
MAWAPSMDGHGWASGSVKYVSGQHGLADRRQAGGNPGAGNPGGLSRAVVQMTLRR